MYHKLWIILREDMYDSYFFIVHVGGTLIRKE